jgi:hypothetical protein
MALSAASVSRERCYLNGTTSKRGLMIMVGRTMVRSRTAAAAISVVLAAGVAVLVNAWTAGWGWPAGTGLGTLVALQAAFAWWQAKTDGQPSNGQRRIVANQQHGVVLDSDVIGVRRLPQGADVEVRQRFDRVDRSTIIGVDGDQD